MQYLLFIFSGYSTCVHGYFSRYLNFTGITCKEIILAGLWTNNCDPMWPVCIDEPYMLKPPCIVYSFGLVYNYGN